MYQNGRDVARLTDQGPGVVHLLGVPRYFWREALANARRACGRALLGDDAAAFAAVLRLVWFAGYAREAWIARLAGTRPLSTALPEPS
jgi:hypothetical protein